MKRVCLILLALFFSVPYINGSDRIDSLKLQINAGTDTNKVQTYYKLFWEYLYRDLNQAQIMVDSIYTITHKMDYLDGKGMAQDAYMNLAIMRGEYEQAKYHIKEQKKIHLTTEHPYTHSAYSQSMAQVYYYQSEFDSAAYYFNEAAKVYLELDHKDYYARMMVNVGSVYQQIGQLEKAISYFIDAETALIDSQDDTDTRFMVAHNIALMFIELQQLEKARVYLAKSKDIATELNSSIYQSKVNTSFGNYHLNLSEYQKAKSYFKQSSQVSLAQQLPNGDNYFGLANVYMNTDSILLARTNYELAHTEFLEASNDNMRVDVLLKLAEINLEKNPYKATKYLTESLTLLKAIKDKGKRLMLTYDFLQTAAFATKSFKEAEYYANLYKHTADSLYHAQSEVKVAELEKKYDQTNKELQIISLQNEKLTLKEEQARRSRRNSIIIFVLGIVVLLIVFRLRYLRDRKKLVEVDLENEKLRREVSEHKNKSLSLINLRQKVDKENLVEEIKKISDESPNVLSTLKTAKIDEKVTANWELYQEVFAQTHPNFVKILKTKYPILTAKDVKICVLIKSDMSIKAMAQLLNVSERAVYTSRYRMKKKLDLGKEDDLELWLNSIE